VSAAAGLRIAAVTTGLRIAAVGVFFFRSA
jgi:hypothetical protein